MISRLLAKGENWARVERNLVKEYTFRKPCCSNISFNIDAEPGFLVMKDKFLNVNNILDWKDVEGQILRIFRISVFEREQYLNNIWNIRV